MKALLSVEVRVRGTVRPGLLCVNAFAGGWTTRQYTDPGFLDFNIRQAIINLTKPA